MSRRLAPNQLLDAPFGGDLLSLSPGGEHVTFSLNQKGYAHITRTAGKNPFIAYAVVNDGAQPGKRSGDGAFISSVP
ncbi:MAG TPA: hypothetical protein VMW38_28190 [Terriglobia bacterium]|nr:hypothetical protein [Terriglobia bacterium]